jgi:hypothetical protein
MSSIGRVLKGDCCSTQEMFSVPNSSALHNKCELTVRELGRNDFTCRGLGVALSHDRGGLGLGEAQPPPARMLCVASGRKIVHPI